MFNVKIDTIRERTTNGPTYMKGRQYFKQGHVKHITYDREKGLILAQVEGTRMHHVRIILNKQGELHDATCTCSAFAAYWGFCRHITAALLYCIDALRMSGDKKKAAALKANSGSKPPSSPHAAAASQTQRRNRSKTRDFLQRMDQVCQLAKAPEKQVVTLRVVLFCPRGTTHAPWLSFAVGQDSLHTVTSIEQFAEAISRDLPLELSQHFTLDPKKHRFHTKDLPLIRLLQDAYENDYKAVFGSTGTANRDRHFVLNGTRMAQFLRLSTSLRDGSWISHQNDSRKAIEVEQKDLPLSMFLCGDDSGTTGKGSMYQLRLNCDQPVMPITSSRNVYLVGNTFYLPPQEHLRTLEPILATFMKPGLKYLQLNAEEAVFLLSDLRPHLQSVCPIEIDSKLQEEIIEVAPECKVRLDYTDSHLKAAVTFQYDSAQINPFETSPTPSDQLVVRDRKTERQLLRQLHESGFRQHGTSLRLTDAQHLFDFIAQGQKRLMQLAQVEKSDDAANLKIMAPPRIRYRFDLPNAHDRILLNQDYDHLEAGIIASYFKALRDKRPFFRYANGSFQQVDLQERALHLSLLRILDFWQVSTQTGSTKLPSYRALALHSVFSQHRESPSLHISETLRDLLEHLHDPGSLRIRTPSLFSETLRPYQKTGFRWLAMLDHYGLGGILADDMGLGKTLQTITFIRYIWQKHKRNTLIIAPTSLIYNWAYEFERFDPTLPVTIIDGNRKQRQELLDGSQRQACLITSYSLLRRDIEAFESLQFGCCFIDEAQNIKNPNTLNARSVKQIKAERYFALTGTPIENTLTELWSIFDFILPGYLHSKSRFQEYFEWPITRDQDEERASSLRRLIAPFLLRRMKKDVLTELPSKIETHNICDMTEAQRLMYDQFLARSRRDLRQELKTTGFAKSQIYILALLTRLRQICCHPGLFVPDYEGGSGKLLMLDELLADSFAAGHRVLLFSQFTTMLDIIRKRVEAKGEKPLYIDGQVAAEERMQLVERFNLGEGRLFLISLRAGGTGLNLTGADTVIHFDPWWNPAVEEQATDRVYRIGQENPVQVIKLFTRHSVEEKILNLQAKKQKLVDSMIQPGQNLLSKMSLDEVLGLFDLKK